ncbi:MAG: alpha/beta hydrolase family esterase [Hyphomicrobiaceae bacterium]
MSSKSIWLLFVVLLACLAPHQSQAQAQSRVPGTAELAAMGLKEVKLRHGNRERLFLVQEPPGPGAPTAVIVLLHGGTQSMRKVFGANAGASREWLTVARANRALLLVPNGTNPESGDAAGDNQFWNDLRSGPDVRTTSVDDVGFILKVLDWARDRDPGAVVPVYVTGASNGGMMTYRLLIEAPHRFTAAAAFIASLPANLGGLSLPKRATPLLIASGTKDPLVKWEGGEIAGKRGAVVSATDNLGWWLRANRAAATPAETTWLPDVDPQDGCRIQRQTFPANDGGAPVVFYTLQGGGHAMPSRKHAIPDTFFVRRFIGPVCRDLETAELAWEFFRSHARAN